jgi:hypothetical protein
MDNVQNYQSYTRHSHKFIYLLKLIVTPVSQTCKITLEQFRGLSTLTISSELFIKMTNFCRYVPIWNLQYIYILGSPQKCLDHWIPSRCDFIRWVLRENSRRMKPSWSTWTLRYFHPTFQTSGKKIWIQLRGWAIGFYRVNICHKFADYSTFCRATLDGEAKILCESHFWSWIKTNFISSLENSTFFLYKRGRSDDEKKRFSGKALSYICIVFLTNYKLLKKLHYAALGHYKLYRMFGKSVSITFMSVSRSLTWKICKASTLQSPTISSEFDNLGQSSNWLRKS